MNTADYLLQNAREEKIVLFDASGSFTYADLHRAAARLAGELLAAGLRAGERVGIFGANSLFWVASYLASLKIGAVAVPFSSLLTRDDIRRNAEFAHIRAVLVDRRQMRASTGVFSDSVAVITDEILASSGPSLWPSTPENFDDDSDAALMFTSGTTARPKAVRVTHANIQANTDSIIQYLDLRESDRMLVILPFFYCFGTSLLHTHLRAGGSLALCNSFAFPETALDMMEQTECTGFAGVPSSFQLLLRISTFSRRELPSLRLIQQAGGKLHGVLVRELVEAKPKAKVFVMYGQTEATARLSYLPPEMLGTKLGSIGKGIPGVELSVLGDEGRPVKPGEIGEIVARGRNISPGYLDDPQATAAKFVDGALRTGDLATVDEDGYIYVVDRADDFIKSWGYRVSSQEIESCVLELQDVVSAAAVGVPSLESGEAIHVFAVLRPDSNLTADAVLAHCREHLAKYMIPERITFIDKLPLNSNGKVVKSELRKRAEE
jgi:acyl-CoA synthetase (AMP-forming)/AMP-acid ligase II